MDNHELAAEWVAWLRNTKHCQTSTLRQYGDTINRWSDWVTDVTKVRPQDIEEFMQRPRRRAGLPSASTQNKDRAVLTTFYKWLQAKGMVDNNPTFFVGVPKVRNRQPKAIPDAMFKQFWSSIELAEDRVWVGLGAFAGLRRMEICSVAPSHFDLHTQKLNYLTRKGGGQFPVEYGDMARVISDGLPDVLPNADQWLEEVAELVEYRQGEHVLVCWDLPATKTQRELYSLARHVPSPDVLYKNLTKLIRQAGLPKGVFSPHALRHTAATNLVRCGVPLEIVRDQLSHSSIDTTMRYLQNSDRLGQWHSANRSQLRSGRSG